MWIYEKRLQYPVKIKITDPHLAQIIIAQYGGPNGEIGASLRYLSQRYSMPYPELKAILTDVGTEESVPRRCTGTGPASPKTFFPRRNQKFRRAAAKVRYFDGIVI